MSGLKHLGIPQIKLLDGKKKKGCLDLLPPLIRDEPKKRDGWMNFQLNNNNHLKSLSQLVQHKVEPIL